SRQPDELCDDGFPKGFWPNERKSREAHARSPPARPLDFVERDARARRALRPAAPRLSVAGHPGADQLTQWNFVASRIASKLPSSILSSRSYCGKSPRAATSKESRPRSNASSARRRQRAKRRSARNGKLTWNRSYAGCFDPLP